MHLTKESSKKIYLAAILHDIGKIGIPSSILSKPGNLSENEFSLIKEHPEIGYNILMNINCLKHIADIILQHHERINGTGYPLGLNGNKILLEAKIISVADVVEAIRSHRPYRPALSTDMAVMEILRCKGVLYDPDVVDACIKVLNKQYTSNATKNLSVNYSV